ncbi:MAG: hypothetical protein JRG81_11235 [Deltaproteobacteria bacterium]|nr:hypothetical protein [Deltaproteobacteria bacterium]
MSSFFDKSTNARRYSPPDSKPMERYNVLVLSASDGFSLSIATDCFNSFNGKACLDTTYLQCLLINDLLVIHSMANWHINDPPSAGYLVVCGYVFNK